ncbi:MAG: PIG-L family deacetylase [Planctomycetaceae bacterium]
MNANPKLLILGAHPDDAEFAAGGLATLYSTLGRTVKMVSVTDGGAGHYRRSASELVELRRNEAANAGAVIGAEYETWEFPDGGLEPTLAVRHHIIREIRSFRPDLVLTHRPCDYHPDHRAVGQCVQDASYLVTVPLVVPEVPALRRDPVVAYLPDLFTRPNPMRPDVMIDIEPHLDTIAAMLMCHKTQVFEWLAYEADILDSVPKNEGDRLPWVRQWFEGHCRPRADRFRAELVARCGEDRGNATNFVEVFEISEYARQPDSEYRKLLFPGSIG